jgi:aspartate/methionine/tyrosine aminotransferase
MRIFSACARGSTPSLTAAPRVGATPQVAELRQLVRPGVTAMVVINFPHNPTGCLPTRAELDEIVSIARDAGAILFSDEMYRYQQQQRRCTAQTPDVNCFLFPTRFLQVGSEPYPSAAALYPRAVALGGLSKSHSCPGLRCAHPHMPLAGTRHTDCAPAAAAAAGW